MSQREVINHLYKHIPFINIAEQHKPLKSEILAAVSQVLDSGRFILGKEVVDFEKKFAKLCGAEYAIAVNSGTDALILALRVLGIGSGDEVITVPNSFVSSTGCIILEGATPVFVDVLDSMNMDWAQLERAKTKNTKAILPVHLTGLPADMDPILDFARDNKLFIIEDCAQAVLAEYKGKRVGAIGDIGCFSLHPLKTLNACGDGGVITTNNRDLYDQLTVMRNLGLRSRDDCVTWSGNSRLDTIQAAILLVKLQYLEEWTLKRRENAALYQEALSGIKDLIVPLQHPDYKAVYHTYVIQAKHRDTLKKYLLRKGVETAIHYPVPIHLHQAAVTLNYSFGDFPVTEKQANSILSLPVYPELNKDDIHYIAGLIRTFFENELWKEEPSES